MFYELCSNFYFYLSISQQNVCTDVKICFQLLTSIFALFMVTCLRPLYSICVCVCVRATCTTSQLLPVIITRADNFHLSRNSMYLFFVRLRPVKSLKSSHFRRMYCHAIFTSHSLPQFGLMKVFSLFLASYWPMSRCTGWFRSLCSSARAQIYFCDELRVTADTTDWKQAVVKVIVTWATTACVCTCAFSVTSHFQHRCIKNFWITV
jgi:hypothetical protein